MATENSGGGSIGAYPELVNDQSDVSFSWKKFSKSLFFYFLLLYSHV